MEADCIVWDPDAGEPARNRWIRDYLNTGRQAYSDHYTHLWPGGNPKPYLSRNFTEVILKRELKEPVLMHWVVYSNGDPAGICKLDFARESGAFHPGAALFLEKIYFKRPFTGRGLGTEALQHAIRLGRQKGKTGIWLEAMQKGPALHFYHNHGFRAIGTTAVPYPEVLASEKAMWVLGRDL